MEFAEENYLAHYGILRKSGRYPWGSGETQEERNKSFLSVIDDLRKSGVKDVDIAKGFDMNTTELRNTLSIAKNAQKQADIGMAQRLKDKGYSNVAIGERMGRPESSVRALLQAGELDKLHVLNTTAGVLKDAVTEKQYVDIGLGVERHMNISGDKLKKAVALLEEEGYTVHRVKVQQLGTGHETRLKVLSAPGTTYAEVYKNLDKVQQVMSYSDTGGRSYDRIMPPISISSKRVGIRYAEQGGADADGVVYVRPGVKDLSLGSARYAQVRIAVDGTHYLKGMAMYKDDLPVGVDLMFNTNKNSTGNKLDAMKPLKLDDPVHPFGAQISKQIQEIGPDGKPKLSSVMNIVNEEGDWEKWSKSLSSQMLSKQSPSLAKTQLDQTHDKKTRELAEILTLDNPAVRQKLLLAYADDADSSAVHLKAAALPRQGSHIILPINSMSEKEVYAPNFNNGERVVLVRYPHGGIFEIPELTVNNRHPEAKKLLGNAKDAIGIHSKVAERLSGADFDGDTVLVIPNNSGKIKTAPPLEGLKGFDPQRAYPHYDGMPEMSSRTKQTEMGLISNLITDMTIKGAPTSELARAVRHSMVVIDAEKHNLNYRQSAIDNGISQLKKKYQGATGGASTIISRASSAVSPADRKTRTDPITGKKVHEYSGETYTRSQTSKRTGITTEKQILKPNKDRSTKLAETENAHTLSSGMPIEKVYADHSNRLKDLANTARREALAIKPIAYSPAAKAAHAEEVKTLEAKLNLALRNSPLERQAQLIANAIVKQKQDANPDMDKAEIKKVKSRALTEARNRTGAQKQLIEITDKEWAAIQAGAISNSRLHQILANANLDQVKKLATPKSTVLMAPDKKAKAHALILKGYTQAEVSEALGVSVSTLKRSLAEDGV